MAVSSYCLTAVNDYRIEYDAEIHRKQNHPLYPSRLSSTYAFGDFETCREVSQKYDWNLDAVRQFKLLDCPLNRVAKVNMERVSLGRHAYRVASISQAEYLMNRRPHPRSRFFKQAVFHHLIRQGFLQ